MGEPTKKTTHSNDFSSATDSHADYAGLLSLEECILWAVSGREMYGLEIVRAIEDVTKGSRQVSVGALYPALHRLEQRSCLVSRMGDPSTESKGGARRKYFRITDNGMRQLMRVRHMRDQLFHWQPQPGLKEQQACSPTASFRQEIAALLEQVTAIESQLKNILLSVNIT